MEKNNLLQSQNSLNYANIDFPFINHNLGYLLCKNGLLDELYYSFAPGEISEQFTTTLYKRLSSFELAVAYYANCKYYERDDENEIFEKLDKAWGRLKDVDRMILESYYVDGCKMEEIARRIGYRNGNSVKSRKNKVLRKIMDLMQEGADFSDLPNAA